MCISKKLTINFLLIIFLLSGCNSHNKSITKDNYPNENVEEKLSEEIEAFLSINKEESFKKETNGALYIYGITSNNCSSISIQTNNEDTGLFDNYKLTEYSYGDTSFKYGIREDWNNLNAGLNKYSIIAYCDNNQIIEEQTELNYTPPQTPITINLDTTSALYNDYPFSTKNQHQTYTTDNSQTYFNTIDYLYSNEASLIVECNNDYIFLGKIAKKYDQDSIFNKYGDHGSKYDNNSIWNKYGDYGSKYSDCSPFNKYTSSPPMILIGENIVGYLSMNQYAGSIIISPNELLLYAYQEFDENHWLDLIQN